MKYLKYVLAVAFLAAWYFLDIRHYERFHACGKDVYATAPCPK